MTSTLHFVPLILQIWVIFYKALFFRAKVLREWLTWDNFVVVAGRSGRLNFFWEPMAAGNGGAENTAATQLILLIHPCISSGLLRETGTFTSVKSVSKRTARCPLLTADAKRYVTLFSVQLIPDKDFTGDWNSAESLPWKSIFCWVTDKMHILHDSMYRKYSEKTILWKQ